MDKLSLANVERISAIQTNDFYQNYVQPSKPVIITDFSSTWSAREKWNYEYFKSKAGNVDVPIYSEPFANTGNSYTKGQSTMRFADYLDLIASQPTNKRMFLFNIFKHIPELCKDFNYPKLMKKYFKGFPFMFFGGQNSQVEIHYDADMSHVLLTQFQGRRRVILAAPEYSTYLYRHPFTVSTNVDIGNPDYERYPLLQYAKFYECILEPGETLFMPSGYWHYVYYLEQGFGLSLRSPASLMKRIEGLFNIFKLTVVDHITSKVFGAQRWYDIKESMAQRKANNLTIKLNLDRQINAERQENE